MKEIPEIRLPTDTERMAITLAAFDIMKQLCIEGKISKEELRLIAQRKNIPIELASV